MQRENERGRDRKRKSTGCTAGINPVHSFSWVHKSVRVMQVRIHNTFAVKAADSADCVEQNSNTGLELETGKQFYHLV